MQLIAHMITDITSCMAIIKIMQRQEPELEAIIIPYPAWEKICKDASPIPNPYAYVVNDLKNVLISTSARKRLYVSGIRVHVNGVIVKG